MIAFCVKACSRQSRVAFLAEALDTDMRHCMDEALIDIDG